MFRVLAFVRANDKGLTLETSALQFFYSGQFMPLTQLIILNYPIVLSHRCRSAVSLGT